MTPHEIFDRIWDILVEHAGAPKDPSWKPLFANYFLSSRSHQEWRFGGTLGFGGKFWRNDGLYYVQCYREDRNPKRTETIERVNRMLSELPYFEPN